MDTYKPKDVVQPKQQERNLNSGVTNESKSSDKVRTWNSFHSQTKGQFKTRTEAAKAWESFKIILLLHSVVRLQRNFS